MNFTKQLNAMQVSAWGGDNSIRFESPQQIPSLANQTGIPVAGTFKDLDGVPIHVLLHMKEGRLDILEIYRENGSDVVRMLPVTDLEIFRPDESDEG